MGKSGDASFEETDGRSYEGLIQSLPLPANMHVVRLESLQGVGSLVVETRLAFALIELFFGRSGQKTVEVEGCDFEEEGAKESGSSNRRTERVDLSPLMDTPLQLTVALGGRA